MATQTSEVWLKFEPEPAPVTDDPNELARYLFAEYRRLAAFVSILSQGQLEVTYVAPAKPRLGMIRIADGTSWNPGGGRGVYWYDPSGAGWTKL